jgi:hypothetical protein
MRKEFSQILILLLLVLTPVSYASVEIPDFSPECSTTQTFELRKPLAGIDGSPSLHPAPAKAGETKERYAVMRSVAPLAFCPDNSFSGRAPPA